MSAIGLTNTLSTRVSIIDSALQEFPFKSTPASQRKRIGVWLSLLKVETSNNKLKQMKIIFFFMFFFTPFTPYS